MKKEIIAAVFLLLLFGGTLFNTTFLLNSMDGIAETIGNSQNAADADDLGTAVKEAERALEQWLKLDYYTHIFVRHSELDATTDVFYELLGNLYSGDMGEARSSYGKLYSHLSSIAEMERITIGNVF